MTAYVENGLTVFVSGEGDAIAFDGWMVRSIGGRYGINNPCSRFTGRTLS